MQTRILEYTIETTIIFDEPSLHEVFARTFDFPAYYGGNWDAWIDCMTDAVIDGDALILLRLKGTEDFQQRCPLILDRLVVCSSFVNDRLNKPRLALIFC